MNIDPKLLREAKIARFQLLASMILALAGGIMIVLQARQLSQIVNRVFLLQNSLSEVLPVFGAMLLVMLGRSVVGFLSEAFASAGSARIKQHYRLQMVNKLIHLGPAVMREEQTGEISNTLTQGIDALDAYFSQFLPQVVIAAVVPLSILLAVFPLDWLTGVVLLVTAPLIPIFMILIGKGSEIITRRQWLTLSRMSAFLLDTLQGLRTLKQLGQSEKQAERVASVADQFRKTTMGVLRVTFLSALVLELVGTISTAVIAVQIGLRLLYGGIDFEPALFVLVVAPDFYLPLRMLGVRFHAAMSGISAANRIHHFLDQPEPQKNQPQNSIPVPGVINCIRFDKVSYRYPGSNSQALEQVSFEIRSGERVALVGPSGSGKSTIAQILLGFIQPDSGQVTINGEPLSAMDLNQWRRQVAWVPQHPAIFNTTLAANIALGDDPSDLQQIKKAADQAFLTEDIARMPSGYNTIVEEAGARLSGGQIQRLALARAFYREAPFLVLDEPTAHLDPELEDLLQGSVTLLCQGKSSLIIAHRLPTITNADLIIVLQNGRLVESGSHADLIENQGIYSQFVAAYGGGS